MTSVLERSALEKKPLKSVFVSDIHLGTRPCRADCLIDFLDNFTCDKLYLVGDIFDFWKDLKTGGWYWDKTHTALTHRFLEILDSGSEVFLIAGNHDETLRAFMPDTMAKTEFSLDVANNSLQKEPAITEFFKRVKLIDSDGGTPHPKGAVGLAETLIHRTADNKQFLIIHGDQFDNVVQNHKWLAQIGDIAYQIAFLFNIPVYLFQKVFGLKKWSLSAWLKYMVKDLFDDVDRFMRDAAEAARKHGMDGVICGHIHRANDVMIDGVRYINDGDFVESCTALLEDETGSLKILPWKTAATEARIDQIINSIPTIDSSVIVEKNCFADMLQTAQ